MFLAPYLCLDLGWKMHGIAIATAIHFFLRFFFTRTICHMDSKLSENMVSIRAPECWEGLGEMFKFGFDFFLLRVMGWWAFDVFTQLAAFLTVRDVAAQTILRNIGLFTFMIPVGISAAMNFFVGKNLGKGDVAMARRFS